MDSPGIYRAICVDSRDPQGLGRIRVRIPLFFGSQASGWAFPSWSMDDLTVWPEDRIPKAGQGVWVAFESADRITWLSTFGEQEFSNQRYDEILDLETGLPVVYETSIRWDVPVFPPDIPVPVQGTLTSPSGVPLEPHVQFQKSPNKTNWTTITTVTANEHGNWSTDYAQPVSESAYWYRAKYDGVVPFWDCVTEPVQGLVPINPSTMTWDAHTQEFWWKANTTITGTLMSGTRPIKDAAVFIYKKDQTPGGAWVRTMSVRTDKYGKWRATWFWQEEWTAAMELRAVYLGSKEYNYADSTVSPVMLPEVKVPVLINWIEAPTNPSYNTTHTISGTVGTDRYGLPPEVSKLWVQRRNPKTTGLWTDLGSVQVTSNGRWSTTLKYDVPDSDYRIMFKQVGVYQNSFSRVLTPNVVLSVTVPTPTIPTLFHGSTFAVTGVIRDAANRPVPVGTVELWWKTATGNWLKSAAPTAAVASNGQFSLNHPALTTLGEYTWRIQYKSGSGSAFLDSTSSEVPRAVGLAVPSSMKAGSDQTHTSCSFSWAAVSGAQSYDVYRNGVLWKSVATPSTSDSGMLLMSTYTYAVRAKAKDYSNADVFSAESSSLRATTGRPEQRASGNLNYVAAPTATGTWRAFENNWSWNGALVAQGYWSTPSANAFGVITYSGEAFRAWVRANYGQAVLDNLNWDSVFIWMARNSTSFAGNTPYHVTQWWHVTSSIAGQGGQPPLAGGTNAGWLNAGESAWVQLPYAHWGKHVLMNENLGGNGGVYVCNSFALYRNNSVEYSRYSAGSISAYCSWNYVTVSKVNFSFS